MSASEIPRSADVVILGAGVMGASIAFHLARRGAGRIVVLDKGDVAGGGSGRSSALVRMHYSFPPEVDLAVRSLEIFRSWKSYVGREGRLAGAEEAWQRLDAAVSRMRPALIAMTAEAATHP